jgi:hypothetical protein
MSESLSRLLAELPPAKPDPTRTEQIRMRCRARLMRHAPRTTPSRGHVQSVRTMQAWQPLIAVLSVVYLTEVIVQALRVYGAR